MFLVASNRTAPSAGLGIWVDTPATFFAAAKAWRQLQKALFDRYRPELHYMRGPGPKSREKHGALQTTRSGAIVTGVPDGVIVIAENEVFRDEEECCARKLPLASPAIAALQVAVAPPIRERRLPRSIGLRLIDAGR